MHSSRCAVFEIPGLSPRFSVCAFIGVCDSLTQDQCRNTLKIITLSLMPSAVVEDVDIGG